MNSKMKSARGIEYRKSSGGALHFPEVKVGVKSPGREYHAKVCPEGKLT
jgi:hypothetical protein